MTGAFSCGPFFLLPPLLGPAPLKSQPEPLLLGDFVFFGAFLTFLVPVGVVLLEVVSLDFFFLTVSHLGGDFPSGRAAYVLAARAGFLSAVSPGAPTFFLAAAPPAVLRAFVLAT